MKTFQSGSINVQASLSFLNITQQALLQACLATSLLLSVISIQQRMDCCIASGCEDGNSVCCSEVKNCTGMEVGDFITVLSYTLNLFMPLNFLGSIYNLVGKSFVKYNSHLHCSWFPHMILVISYGNC
jgi:ATP-binding cassette, subfamily B, heavy metal transporter